MADAPDPASVISNPDQVSLRKETEPMGSRWSSPLVLALLAAAFGLAGNVWVEHANNKWKKDTNFFNVQSSLIVDAIRTNDPNAACQNLRLLIGLGYLNDKYGSVKAQCLNVPPAPPFLPLSDKTGPKSLAHEASASSSPD